MDGLKRYEPSSVCGGNSMVGSDYNFTMIAHNWSLPPKISRWCTAFWVLSVLLDYHVQHSKYSP
ncbi:MAG: hypothetical protein PVSMB1_18350 [Gemmatimonadaceae bacterium]